MAGVTRVKVAVIAERPEDGSRLDRVVDYDVTADENSLGEDTEEEPLLSHRQKVGVLRVLEGLLSNLRAMLLAAAEDVKPKEKSTDGCCIFNLLISRTGDEKCNIKLEQVKGAAPSCVATAFH